MPGLLRNIFGFWFFPLLFFAFLVPQSFYVAAFYFDYLSFLVLILSLLVILTYAVSYYFGLRFSCSRDMCLTKGKMKVFNFILGFYFVSYFILYMHYGGVPIIDVLVGGREPSVARSSFYKEVEGFYSVFVYLRSILTRGFLPFAIIVLFLSRSRRSFYTYLLLLSVVNVSALEKGLLFWFYGPLLLFTLIKNFKRDFCFSLIMMMLFFCVVTAAALEVGGGQIALNKSTYQVREDSDLLKGDSDFGYKYEYAFQKNEFENGVFSFVSLKDKDNYQFLMHDVREGNVFTYLVNRILWIPYVTVYDTLGYWYQKYDGFLVFGVNRHLAALTGYEFANLEREVFRYQFGSGYSSTGNANSAFFAEAYIGFGFVGVVLFSSIIGLFSGVIGRSGLCAFTCSLPFVLKGLISSSLISMFFSGGMFFYIFCYLYFARRLRIVSND